MLVSVGKGFNVTVADAVLLVSAALVAVTVTYSCTRIIAGAVYKPEALIVPILTGIRGEKPFRPAPEIPVMLGGIVLPLKLHVTPVLLVFVTVAVNCCVCEANSEADAGATPTVTGGFTVNTAALLVPPPVVTVTFAAPVAALAAIVNVAVI
jgi:hypothetical protein